LFRAITLTMARFAIDSAQSRDANGVSALAISEWMTYIKALKYEPPDRTSRDVLDAQNQ
jgi:hypothetical protein